MATPNLSEIITTTLRHRSKKLSDLVTANTALLMRLKEKGKVKTFSGGREIVEELAYAENGTFGWYSGYETLDISPQDVLTAANFDIKQCAVAVSISGLEQLQNSGPDALIDLLEARIENAEQTLVNNISAGVYSDGTGDGGKQIGGLQLLVADDPTTGTVGGINRGTYTWWRNQVWDATADGAATSATTIQANMNGLWVKCLRGTDRPDLILMDNVYYKFFLGSMQAIQRITEAKTATAGFVSLKFIDADVICDGGYGGDCPASHAYFLNTNHIHFRPHKERNMVPIGGERMSVNQDAMVKLIGFAGNMTLRNAFLQGVYKE